MVPSQIDVSSPRPHAPADPGPRRRLGLAMPPDSRDRVAKYASTPLPRPVHPSFDVHLALETLPVDSSNAGHVIICVLCDCCDRGTPTHAHRTS